jgi:subtilase family serine protease
VTFVAVSGDSGSGVLYPATSPDVVAVGGTTLKVDPDGNYLEETAWSGSGGGLSSFEPEPLYQAKFKIPNNPLHWRGTPDVAYNGDPKTGFAVYTSIPFQGLKGWLQIGGTSAGVPQWAALIASANSARVQAGKVPLTGSNAELYIAATRNYKANYHDITTGTNGSCGAVCTAAPGYDYVTGLGTPRASALVKALAQMP